MKVKKVISALIILTVGFLQAVANDSEYFAEGNQLIPLRQTTIAVRKEILKIKICPDGFAEVDVDYVFENPAEAHTLLMGFETSTSFEPTIDEILNKGTDYIKDFKVVLNGSSLPYKIATVMAGKTVDENGNIRPINWKEWELSDDYGPGAISDSYGNDETCIYAYYFDAEFLSGMNTLHHHYRYRMGNGIGRPYFLDYKLTPALRWANGQIDDFTLEISAEGNMCDFYISAGLFHGQKPVFKGAGKNRQVRNNIDEDVEEIVLRNASVVFHVTNFKPKEELYLCSAMEFSYYFNDPATMKYEPVCAAQYCFWDESDIADLNNTDRHIIRNLPFAARGHVFKKPELAAFFKKCWWYMPDPSGKDMKTIPLTSDEKELIEKYSLSLQDYGNKEVDLGLSVKWATCNFRCRQSGKIWRLLCMGRNGILLL